MSESDVVAGSPPEELVPKVARLLGLVWRRRLLVATVLAAALGLQVEGVEVLAIRQHRQGGELMGAAAAH